MHNFNGKNRQFKIKGVKMLTEKPDCGKCARKDYCNYFNTEVEYCFNYLEVFEWNKTMLLLFIIYPFIVLIFLGVFKLYIKLNYEK